MKTIRSAPILLIIILIVSLTDAHATSLRCGVRLITEGDFKARVLAECGEPDHVEVWRKNGSTDSADIQAYTAFSIIMSTGGRMKDTEDRIA